MVTAKSEEQSGSKPDEQHDGDCDKPSAPHPAPVLEPPLKPDVLGEHQPATGANVPAR